MLLHLTIVIRTGKIVWKYGPCCWYFRLNVKYLGWPYRAYIKTAKNGDFSEEVLSENDFEAVLATFCCYDHGAKASEAVQKITIDQKEYRKCSLCIIIFWIAKIYLSFRLLCLGSNSSYDELITSYLQHKDQWNYKSTSHKINVFSRIKTIVKLLTLIFMFIYCRHFPFTVTVLVRCLPSDHEIYCIHNKCVKNLVLSNTIRVLSDYMFCVCPGTHSTLILTKFIVFLRVFCLS